VAGAEKKKQQGEEEEKRGTVRFWVPDLLVSIPGHKDHFAITEMSLKSLAFSPLDDTFELDKKFKFNILRLSETGTKPEIKHLRGQVMRVDQEAVGLALSDLNAEQEKDIKELIEAAQERQKEEVREKKEIKFELDMLFM